MSEEEEIYRSKEAEAEIGVEVPYTMLPVETLEEMIKEFVLREGTDYGASEASLESKILQIKSQLERKMLKIVFDIATETSSIVPATR